MKMNKEKLSICMSRTKCELCRRRTVSGEEFRTEFLGDKDAECPYGIQWDVEAGPLKAHFRKYKIGTKLKILLHQLGMEACPGCNRRVTLFDLDFGSEGLTKKTPPPIVEEEWQDES